MTDIVTPPEIDALPPPPQPTDTPEVFDAKSYASLQAQAAMVTQLNAANDATHQNAVAAEERAAAADQSAQDADQAKADALQAKDDAEDAVASISTLSDQYQGASATNPTMRKDGSPLQAGDFYTYIGPPAPAIRTYSGSVWVSAVASSGGVSDLNGQTGSLELPKVISYANRGTLRANETWVHALVDGLGWFQWVSGSDEPDDDESCFATTSGRWLLQAPHWDVVDQWRLPESSARDRQLEDLLAAWPGRVLRGSGVCGITSVATVASTAFAVSVVGAAVGDRVIATPPAALGNTDADSGRLSYHAYVSATDTVTVRLCNASAATATTSAAARGAWPVIVIKEV